MMKKILFVLSILAVVSCKQRASGNKDILPAPAASTETPTATEAQSNYSYHPETTKLTWTAYKTPEKVGVKGTFKEIEVSGTKTSPIKEEVLSGASFKINSISVDSGDETRDDRLKKLFFESMTSPEITGSFGTFDKGEVPVTLTMNGKEITKNFEYTFADNKIVITGVIDIIKDFDIEKGFNLLHDACKELHKGKTWTDVSIEVITTL